VVRHDGSVGAAFTAKTAGHSFHVRVPAGYGIETPLVIVRDEKGRPTSVSGELDGVRKIAQSMGGNTTDRPVVETLKMPPPVRILFGVTGKAHRGIVKAALHFVAAMDVGPDPRVPIQSIVGDILTARIRTNDLLTFTRVEAPFFIEDSRPHHEIACFEGESHTTVTVDLFGVYRFLVRIDGVRCERTVRYVQYLDGSPPSVTTENRSDLIWRRLDRTEVADLLRHVQERIMAAYRKQNNDFLNKCVSDAMPKALASYFRHPTDEGLAPHLEAELQITLPTTTLRHEVIRQVVASSLVPRPPRTRR
jgi:hypothetical protein